MLINILTEPCVILQIGQERPRYEIADLGLFFLPSSYWFHIFILGEVCMLRTQNNDQFNHWDFHLQVCTYSAMSNAMQAPVSPPCIFLCSFCLIAMSKFYAVNVFADCFKRRYQYGTPSTVICSQRNTWMPKWGKKTKIWRLLWSQIQKITTQN